MSMSRSRARPTEAAKSYGRQGRVDSSRVSRGTTPPPARTTPSGPEWRSARWKLQVEAEARSRLKKVIRDIGSER